jgi:DNA polymerase-3 subunit alpha
VREALRARVDCGLADLAGKPDGAWVTVGGIVTESKKIRTKSGSQMMFATLDDVEGQVEMLVFKADQAESAEAIATDAIVLVRGRIDHKERGETKLVVQEAERFEPDGDEIARAGAAASAPSEPLRLTIDAANLRRPGMLDQLKEVLEHHKGEADVHLTIPTEGGERTEVRLGNGYRVRPSSGLRAELDQVLGTDALAA